VCSLERFRSRTCLPTDEWVLVGPDGLSGASIASREYDFARNESAPDLSSLASCHSTIPGTGPRTSARPLALVDQGWTSETPHLSTGASSRGVGPDGRGQMASSKFSKSRAKGGLAIIPAKMRSKRGELTRLVVARSTTPAGQGKFLRGRLHAGSLVVPCAIGAAGSKHGKREGDHASPVGTFSVLRGFYRIDRRRRLRVAFALHPIRPELGWCDDPSSPSYNRMVATSCPWSHERLWRDDSLYDVVVVLDYNIRRRCKGRGSAIFLHCAHSDLAPTEGCIALRYDDLRRLLPRLSPHVVVTVL
jgi:L,D-peptidoglycan transpeptidase YkuD (ErfK/YbiS/YcfS/YnhG family)